MKTIRNLTAPVVLAVAVILISGVCMAQEDVFNLGEVVVEGSSGVQDIAMNTTVTAEDIRMTGAVNAAEALDYVPGVTVVTTTKGEKNINIQGFGQKDVLVLIDGVPYYETKNGPLDLQHIPAGIIGRIDVTKGASSVLYGPNALGGVVNIITKKGVKGTSGKVTAEGGRGGYGRGAVTLNHGSENGFSILGSVDYQTRDNLYFSDDYVPREASIRFRGTSDGRSNPRTVNTAGEKKNSDLESLNLWTRLGFNPTEKLELYTSLYRFDLERGRLFSDEHNRVLNFSGGYSTFGRYDSYLDTGADFSGKLTVNDWMDLRASAFYHSHEDDYTSYVSEDLAEKIATSTWDDDAYGVSLFSDLFLDRYGMLSLTAQYRNDQHNQRDDAGMDWEDSESSTLTVAAEDTITMGQFRAVLGLAYHHFDAEKIADLGGYTEQTLDPMAGLTWQADNGLELFGAIARKTRFPVFADMESDGVIYRLDPEKNINYTLGAKTLVFDRTQIELSGFYNDIEDRIGELNDEPANIDEAKIYGIELNTDTRITSRLSLGFDCVLTHARNESDNRDSDYLEDVPEYTMAASVRYMIPKLEAMLTVKGAYKDGVIYSTDTEEKENFTVVDLSLVKDWDNGFSLGGHIRNLLDENYDDGYGMACDGFDYKVTARYAF